MEIRRRFDFRKVFVGTYAAIFVVILGFSLNTADAAEYEISAKLEITSLGLVSDVTKLSLNGRELPTPDTIVGSFSRAENKTLLIGHSSTVFEDLDEIQTADIVTYAGRKYTVNDIRYLAKEEVSMGKILAGEQEDTIVLMTCAGDDLGGGDATHRLIVTAVRAPELELNGLAEATEIVRNA